MKVVKLTRFGLLLHRLKHPFGCHKERIGYACRHRVIDGTRECDGEKVL